MFRRARVGHCGEFCAELRLVQRPLALIVLALGVFPVPELLEDLRLVAVERPRAASIQLQAHHVHNGARRAAEDRAASPTRSCSSAGGAPPLRRPLSRAAAPRSRV